MNSQDFSLYQEDQEILIGSEPVFKIKKIRENISPNLMGDRKVFPVLKEMNLGKKKPFCLGLFGVTKKKFGPILGCKGNFRSSKTVEYIP